MFICSSTTTKYHIRCFAKHSIYCWKKSTILVAQKQENCQRPYTCGMYQLHIEDLSPDLFQLSEFRNVTDCSSIISWSSNTISYLPFYALRSSKNLLSEAYPLPTIRRHPFPLVKGLEKLINLTKQEHHCLTNIRQMQINVIESIK